MSKKSTPLSDAQTIRCCLYILQKLNHIVYCVSADQKQNKKKFSLSCSTDKYREFDINNLYYMIEDLMDNREDFVQFIDYDFSLSTVSDLFHMINLIALYVISLEK